VPAARALGNIGDRRALPYLIANLDSGSEELQEASVQAIGEIGEKESIARVLKMLAENRSERMLGSGAEAISKHGVIEAVLEIFPRMHETANPVLQRQLAIAIGNLLGKPGEFYRYVTGERINQVDSQDQLFDRIQDVLRTLAQVPSATLPAVEQLDGDALLARIRKEAENERFESALRLLSQLYSHVARILFPHAGGDDESLIAFAIYHNQQLGLSMWLVKEAEKKLEKGLAKELLGLDMLLGLYGLSYFHYSGDR